MTRGCTLLLHVLQLIFILEAAENNFVDATGPKVTASPGNVASYSNNFQPIGEYLGVEYYEFEGERYAIFMQKVTWEEASQLCAAKNGSLADFEPDGLAEFVARALAESAVGFGALWINGKLVKAEGNATGEWMWYSKNTMISVTDSPSYPMNSTPFWVDKPPLSSEKEMCLGTDRRLHHLPLIVPIECKQERPYICKIPNDVVGKPKPAPPPIPSGTKRFHIFQGAVTWAEALAECRTLGFKLAKLVRADDFTKIGHRMLRIRPVMENAWIGGSYSEGNWTWVSTNEPILTNITGSSDNEKFAWYRPDNIIPEGCLLADRHVCDHFVYVEAKCDRRRPFICEEETSSDGTKPLVPAGGGIWISSFKETWEKAQVACEECLKGTLLQIPAKQAEVAKVLPHLYNAMALSIRIEIRHVWIGGYLFGKNFKWTSGSKKEPEGDDTILDPAKYDITLSGIGDQGVLVYCNVSLETETYLLKYKCLNMDRENQKHFFMYGLNCDLKQYFICKTDESITQMEDCKFNKADNKTKIGVPTSGVPPPAAPTEPPTTVAP